MKHRIHSLKRLVMVGVAALAVTVAFAACGQRGTPTTPHEANKISVHNPGSSLTVQEYATRYASLNSSPDDYLKDSNLSGTLTAVRDGRGQVTGWTTDISGTHFEEPVSYSGAVVGQAFVPALPGLDWLPDDAEMMPGFDQFLPITIDPDALQYMDTMEATIDAPLSGTTWASYLGTRGIGGGTITPGGIHPVPAKPGVLETGRRLIVTVNDPSTGEPLTRTEATALLQSRGWSDAEIDLFLSGAKVDADHPIYDQGKLGDLTVTLSATVEVEVSVPPFASVTVSGTATLSGPASEYAEIAEKVSDMATDLADKLADKIKDQLEKLKDIIDGLVDDFIDWVAELLEGVSIGDLFGWW